MELVATQGTVTLLVLDLDFFKDCLLYTSDAADERSSVDLGGRRIIKKKQKLYDEYSTHVDNDEHKNDGLRK